MIYERVSLVNLGLQFRTVRHERATLVDSRARGATTSAHGAPSRRRTYGHAGAVAQIYVKTSHGADSPEQTLTSHVADNIAWEAVWEPFLFGARFACDAFFHFYL